MINQSISSIPIQIVWTKEEIDLIFDGELDLFAVPGSMLVSSFRNPRDLLCAPSITGKIVIIPTLDESQVNFNYT